MVVTGAVKLNGAYVRLTGRNWPSSVTSLALLLQCVLCVINTYSAPLC